MTIFFLVLAVSGLASICFKYLQLKKKYAPLLDIENEIQKLNELKRSAELQTAEAHERYRNMKASVDTLEKDHQMLVDDLDVAQAGLIKLKYDFKTSKQYEERLDDIREKQKSMIKDGRAIVCPVEWTVGGSKAEGKKMINKLIKLGLNSFNAQSDNIILNVKYTNYDRSKEKLYKLEESTEKLLEVNGCKITSDFFSLKMEELELVFEYQEKVYEEKEEQKRIRLQMQEEERVRKEIERIKIEAEKEELYFAKALEKAKKDLEKKKDSEKEAFMLKINELELQLKEAHEKKERAISQAEQTKRGHVYIISNIGSFGENVFKIGMTRRLEPMDRVDELSDASVPFDFDVHAMIFSEDAPGLENRLHKIFSYKRTNQVNLRKEFFNVTIDEIEAACKSHLDDLKITKVAEAKDYYQTLQKMKEIEQKKAA